MDRDNNRSINAKEVKLFVKFMGKYRANITEEDEVKGFFETADEDDDGEISVYEFLLAKYPKNPAGTTSNRRPPSVRRPTSFWRSN